MESRKRDIIDVTTEIGEGVGEFIAESCGDAAGGGIALGKILLNGVNVATTADGILTGINKK